MWPLVLGTPLGKKYNANSKMTYCSPCPPSHLHGTAGSHTWKRVQALQSKGWTQVRVGKKNCSSVLVNQVFQNREQEPIFVLCTELNLGRTGGKT